MDVLKISRRPTHGDDYMLETTLIRIPGEFLAMHKRLRHELFCDIKLWVTISLLVLLKHLGNNVTYCVTLETINFV